MGSWMPKPQCTVYLHTSVLLTSIRFDACFPQIQAHRAVNDCRAEPDLPDLLAVMRSFCNSYARSLIPRSRSRLVKLGCSCRIYESHSQNTSIGVLVSWCITHKLFQHGTPVYAFIRSSVHSPCHMLARFFILHILGYRCLHCTNSRVYFCNAFLLALARLSRARFSSPCHHLCRLCA